MKDILRRIALRPTDTGTYVFESWDTNRSDEYGKSILGYRLTAPDGTVLFEGEDFHCSPMHAVDSDSAVRCCLGFLTLHPGDTDDEYFATYTPEQTAFADSYDCESMGLYADEEAAEPLEDLPDEQE